eukprot:scaffold15366_cov70-Phaeocystis_antarctica.AAC.4
MSSGAASSGWQHWVWLGQPKTRPPAAASALRGSCRCSSAVWLRSWIRRCLSLACAPHTWLTLIRSYAVSELPMTGLHAAPGRCSRTSLQLRCQLNQASDAASRRRRVRAWLTA